MLKCMLRVLVGFLYMLRFLCISNLSHPNHKYKNISSFGKGKENWRQINYKARPRIYVLLSENFDTAIVFSSLLQWSKTRATTKDDNSMIFIMQNTVIEKGKKRRRIS